MLRLTPLALRGYKKPELYGGDPLQKFSVRRVGAIPRIRSVYTSLTRSRPERPPRAIPSKRIHLPPVLYQRADQLIELDRALVLKRTELQVQQTMRQLSVNLRNAEDFVEKQLMDSKLRPSMHELWFHERGFHRQQHVISLMPSHTMIQFISLIAHDVEVQRMDIAKAEELYFALSESTVAHAPIVKRELCNTMLRCYVLNGDVKKAIKIVHEMKANNIRRNFVTYAPLFRLARRNGDVDLDDEIRMLIHEIEGGFVPKFFLIDVPRVLSLAWVAVRYNWAAVWTCLLLIGGLITCILICITGFF